MFRRTILDTGVTGKARLAVAPRADTLASGKGGLVRVIEDMFRPLRRYADFRGRARRREYWLFIVLSWLIVGPVLGIGFALGWHPYDAKGEFNPIPPAGGSLLDMGCTAALVVVTLALFLPWLAVQVRRLHDSNRSGWNLLWNFVPYIGWLVLFFYMVVPGTEGPNRYGRDPTEEVDDWGRVIS